MDIYTIGAAFIGLIIGGGAAWMIAANRASAAEGKVSVLEENIKSAAADFDKLRADLDHEREAKVKAETEAAGMIQQLENEKRLLGEAEKKLIDTFKALAGDTLEASNKSFIELAGKTLGEVVAHAKGDLGKRQEAIAGMVKPLSESLKLFEDHVRQLEQRRVADRTDVEGQIKNLASVSEQLRTETGNLVTALREPRVRGRWGEMTLRRVAELAGMSEHCDFSEQVSGQSDEGRIRPDMIVHLPAGREIVVDAKVSLVGYLDSLAAESEADKIAHMNKHARQIRDHMKTLGAKDYWKQFNKAPEFVVMFIPGESFFAAAAHSDHDLMEDGMQRKVVLATPTTLIALLWAVAYGWRQEQMAEGAEKISELGKNLHDRMRVLAEHLAGVGQGLERANTSYNKAVSSMEARVLPAARRFRELGVSGDEIKTLEPIETAPRSLNSPDQTSQE